MFDNKRLRYARLWGCRLGGNALQMCLVLSSSTHGGQEMVKFRWSQIFGQHVATQKGDNSQQVHLPRNRVNWVLSDYLLQRLLLVHASTIVVDAELSSWLWARELTAKATTYAISVCTQAPSATQKLVVDLCGLKPLLTRAYDSSILISPSPFTAGVPNSIWPDTGRVVTMPPRCAEISAKAAVSRSPRRRQHKVLWETRSNLCKDIVRLIEQSAKYIERSVRIKQV